MFRFTALPPLSLYIHLPWCVRKCPYCDFNSHAVREELPEDAYVDALISDLEQDLPRVWGRHVHTIFMGGGTPSLFSPAVIDRLLSAVRARLFVAPDAEVTLEANPGTVEVERFRGYRQAGVNRLSIGIQSFDEDKLKALGRIHGHDEALRAAAAACDAGFENFNLDLMFGLPRQTLAQALADLETAIALAPAHLSLYQLTIEPNTLFHHRPPALPDDDATYAMQEALQARLRTAGYDQYEVSAYAQAGRQCAHNRNYWRFGDYLGIGAGAHAKITDAAGITRLWKAKQPKEYMTTAGTPPGIGGERRLTRAEVGLEFMMNVLRLTGGVESPLFAERTSLPLSLIEARLRAAEDRGLIEWDAHHIRPTELGRRFLNDLLALFLPEDDTGT
jgi:oxygen-independent coproporphyrinogen-3 oxidase